jgi:acyl-CoA dehydrogenase
VAAHGKFCGALSLAAWGCVDMSDIASNELLEPFERLLADVSSLTQVRALEAGASVSGLWAALHESGFVDAMVSEAQGGAGLSLADAGPLVQALGRQLVPVPFAQTMVARALLAAAGAERPEGSIVFVSPTTIGAGYQQRAVPQALVANYALVDLGERTVLTSLSDATVTATGIHASQAADVSWQTSPRALATIATPKGGLRPIAAVLRAAEIAGAADRVLSMTIAYAGERVQFGKPIGKQQAIQQQLAVMAEQTVMARMAAQIGCAHGLPPPANVAAVAKQIASAAVITIAATAHAVHGAIGISEEYDLQLFVRRLHEWRIADGTESYWAEHLGRARLASDAGTSVDFVRLEVSSVT